ncbi:MAG: hypothetical protein ACLFUM_10540 [Spirochaetaceae bacterium]
MRPKYSRRLGVGSQILMDERHAGAIGDDLYCYQPICELLPDLNGHVKKRWDGKKRLTYRYRFANGVPIKDGEDAPLVNWMELVIFVGTLFESWEALMLCILEGLDLENPGG